MKSPQVVLIYDRKKIASTNKRATLEVRITYNRKVKYISTGVSLLPKEWNGRCVTSRLDCVILQQRINMLVENIQRVINDMMRDNCIMLQEIPSRLKLLENEGLSFMEFCEKRAEVRKYNLAPISKERYDRFLRYMRNWGKIVQFTDISDVNILELDKRLTATGMKPYSRWNNYHRFLNSFIIDAINDGHIRRNPYKWVRVDKERTNGSLEKYLEREEIKKIMDVELPTKCLERVRDLFIFQTYTCLAYSDMMAFDVKNIQRDAKGRSLYVAKRNKTDIGFTILLLDDAIKILEKYDYKLPVITNEKYNDYLKIVAFMAGVNKPISSHWARHTGATLLLNAGVDMEIVAKVLGHSSTKITREIYAKLLDSTVADAVDNIKDLI